MPAFENINPQSLIGASANPTKVALGNGTWVEPGSSGGGGFVFQVGGGGGGIEPPPFVANHYHLAHLSLSQARSLVEGTVPTVEIVSEEVGAHQHTVTVIFDAVLHSFVAVNVSTAGNQPHVAFLIGAPSDDSQTPYLFQISENTNAHHHVASISIAQAKFLIGNTAATVQVVTDTIDGHDHTVTIGYNHLLADFIIQDIINNAPAGDGESAQTSPNHHGLLVGKSATGGGGGVISKTYAELKAIKDADGLIQGQTYLINDYQTIHSIYHTTDVCENGVVIQTGGDFANYLGGNFVVNGGEPLLITAVSANKFDTSVRSTVFPTDVIEYNFDPTWFYYGDLSTDFVKGEIIRRFHTEQSIETFYDFRTYRFRRYNVSGCRVDDGNESYADAYETVLSPTTGTPYGEWIDGNPTTAVEKMSTGGGVRKPFVYISGEIVYSDYIPVGAISANTKFFFYETDTNIFVRNISAAFPHIENKYIYTKGSQYSPQVLGTYKFIYDATDYIDYLTFQKNDLTVDYTRITRAYLSQAYNEANDVVFVGSVDSFYGLSECYNATFLGGVYGVRVTDLYNAVFIGGADYVNTGYLYDVIFSNLSEFNCPVGASSSYAAGITNLTVDSLYLSLVRDVADNRYANLRSSMVTTARRIHMKTVEQSMMQKIDHVTSDISVVHAIIGNRLLEDTTIGYAYNPLPLVPLPDTHIVGVSNGVYFHQTLDPTGAPTLTSLDGGIVYNVGSGGGGGGGGGINTPVAFTDTVVNASSLVISLPENTLYVLSLGGDNHAYISPAAYTVDLTTTPQTLTLDAELFGDGGLLVGDKVWGTALVGTVAKQSLEFQFIAGYESVITCLVGSSQAGVYLTQTVTGTASNIIYTVNGIAETLPLTLVAGDSLGVTLTKSDAVNVLLKLEN